MAVWSTITRGRPVWRIAPERLTTGIFRARAAAISAFDRTTAITPSPGHPAKSLNPRLNISGLVCRTQVPRCRA